MVQYVSCLTVSPFLAGPHNAFGGPDGPEAQHAYDVHEHDPRQTTVTLNGCFGARDFASVCHGPCRKSQESGSLEGRCGSASAADREMFTNQKQT
jgi:hypothetical protein